VFQALFQTSFLAQNRLAKGFSRFPGFPEHTTIKAVYGCQTAHQASKARPQVERNAPGRFGFNPESLKILQLQKKPATSEDQNRLI
jgi:hypothetical protein